MATTRERMDVFSFFACRGIYLLQSVFPEAIKMGWHLVSCSPSHVPLDDEQLLYSALVLDYVNVMIERTAWHRARLLGESPKHTHESIIEEHRSEMRRSESRLISDLNRIRVKTIKNGE